MTKEFFLAQAGVYAVIASVVIARLIWRGRTTWKEFERRNPEMYLELGRPMPGLFQSQRRNRHAAYLAQRKHEDLADDFYPRFERLHGTENRAVFLLIGGMLYLGSVALWYKDTWPT